MVSLKERFRGSLLGVYAGDSLGAPYEKKSPSYIDEGLAKRGGLVPHRYADPWGRSGFFEAGRPTDDTELTAALAVSIVERDGSDPAHQYQLFREVIGGKSFIWDGKPDGFGGTTRIMLESPTYEESQARDDKPYIASNGSLMRSAPLGLWLLGSSEGWQRIVAASSSVTHIHPTAIECCVQYVHLLKALLVGLDRDVAWETTRHERIDDPELAYLLSMEHHELLRPKTTNKWMKTGGPAGSALHTFHIAAWSLLNAESFANGLELAVRFSGDTDTAAAVAGGLLGAHYGVEGIPEDWRDALIGRDRMIELADGLYEKRFGSGT
ncbi:MAG: ADP-ribosylglycohydrolase family protein [Candidatus Pacebacteria bacterium]|nr:ADP-ribosylglycohydrolase family protein [Candidatus Paceibacterota bacterium]MBP9840228.1 ADP-ribosylglycohydrolase family protein [Candidatus Paceibacterota bacterium]